MLIIGLTGGIGSGKSSVALLFAKKGITVIDTDQLARDVTEPGQVALNKIIEKFGPSILNSDATLNRAKLRAIIFEDAQQRTWLEELLHPLIRNEITKQVNLSHSPYCIVVIPLLIETAPNPLINRVLVVDTNENEQIKRTQIRDNKTAEEVKAILKTQASRSQRLMAADDIIENEGSLNDLTAQVDRLHAFYLSLSTTKNEI